MVGSDPPRKGGFWCGVGVSPHLCTHSPVHKGLQGVRILWGITPHFIELYLGRAAQSLTEHKPESEPTRPWPVNTQDVCSCQLMGFCNDDRKGEQRSWLWEERAALRQEEMLCRGPADSWTCSLHPPSSEPYRHL